MIKWVRELSKVNQWIFWLASAIFVFASTTALVMIAHILGIHSQISIPLAILISCIYVFLAATFAPYSPLSLRKSTETKINVNPGGTSLNEEPFSSDPSRGD
ncbi:MAG: hypothetical protein A3K08_02155 [Candidatus Doudnabacteria bacterium RIFCSPLOWO2_01_41_7]|nr:MAG: hypothetical protein A3K08_02155 [Candidatus Doudnabacteria bacterium RIFCSPLOWO2_01_41_7]